MILSLSFIFILFSCAEQSHTSLVSQSRINAGPYIRSEQVLTLPVTGETTIHIQGTTQKDFENLHDVTDKVVPFVSSYLSDDGNLSCNDGLINIHIIPDKKLNDRNIMTFTKNETPGKEFYGITTYVFPNVAWSFICSDCDESPDDILVHELAHFYMAQCGISPEDHDETDCHEMVDVYKKSKQQDG